MSKTEPSGTNLTRSIRAADPLAEQRNELITQLNRLGDRLAGGGRKENLALGNIDRIIKELNGVYKFDSRYFAVVERVIVEANKRTDYFVRPVIKSGPHKDIEFEPLRDPEPPGDIAEMEDIDQNYLKLAFTTGKAQMVELLKLDAALLDQVQSVVAEAKREVAAAAEPADRRRKPISEVGSEIMKQRALRRSMTPEQKAEYDREQNRLRQREHYARNRPNSLDQS